MAEPELVHLRFQGMPMGTLAYRSDASVHALELDRSFLATGHQLSPVHLPLESFARGPRLFRPGDSPFDGGLPGLIADSLPDAWGERMLRAEAPTVRTIVGKLAAIGERGPGAITFEPPIAKGADTDAVSTNLARMAREASQIARAATLTPAHVDAALARGGSSLAGVRPKVSAHLPDGGDFQELRNIQIGGPVPTGHSPAIVKLSLVDEDGGGAVEFAYWKMAQNAGIRMPRACLINDGERRHFASARFDRVQRPDGMWGRRHVHTLSGMLHKRASDGNMDYEEFMRVSRTLGGVQEAKECFRRAIFNLLAVNRDDHGRNHAFMYDEKSRTWSHAPAYDLNPSVANVLIGLTWLGSAEVPKTKAQVVRLGEIGGLSAADAKSIYQQVESAVIGGWREAAAYAGVPKHVASVWEKEIQGQTKALRGEMHEAPRPVNVTSAAPMIAPPPPRISPKPSSRPKHGPSLF